MTKRQLKAKDIEKLENTSVAQALGGAPAGDAGLVGGQQDTSWFACSDSCNCAATGSCDPTATCPSEPSATCPSGACEPVSVLSTACCDAVVEQARATFERLVARDAVVVNANAETDGVETR